MNKKIMARLRGGAPSFRILFDEENLPDIGLEVPTGLGRARPYSPNESSVGDFDLYYVELDQEQKNKMIDPYIEALSFGTEHISQPEYDAVNAIYKISGRKLIFSRVSSGARIGENGKTMLAFGENGVTVSPLSFMIDFSGTVDAYYDGVDRIYFSKFSKAKPLFRGFDEFYQEAWYDDKESFLENELFAVSEIEPEDIGTADTNKIAEIRSNNKLDLGDPKTILKIHDYINKYPLSGVILNSDGRIKITTKDDLKCTIKLLTQCYYTSELTGETLEARSTERMKDQKAKQIVGGVEVNSRSDNK